MNEQLTETQQEALNALKSRSDWACGYGHLSMMCLGYTRYGWTCNEARAEYYKACNELILAHRAELTLAEYQAARIIEDGGEF